jgi:hypothetical protein
MSAFGSLAAGRLLAAAALARQVANWGGKRSKLLATDDHHAKVIFSDEFHALPTPHSGNSLH